MHEGATLWRGHFTSSGEETGVNLTIAGGRAFAASVWLNDQFLGSTYGNSSNDRNAVAETNQLYTFPKRLSKGDEAVITVVVDNMGLEMEYDRFTDGIRSPRGITGYELVNGTFSHWRVQGKQGGNTNFPDRERGIFNEGGFYAERAGWHLPSFPLDKSWTSRSPNEGLTEAGLGVFKTTFELDIPAALDVPLSFRFSQDEAEFYRVQLFVNGWNFGKRISYLGPQRVFPVPEGILDHRGVNTLVLIVWATESTGARLGNITLEHSTVLLGGIGPIAPDNPAWKKRKDADEWPK